LFVARSVSANAGSPRSASGVTADAAAGLAERHPADLAVVEPALRGVQLAQLVESCLIAVAEPRHHARLAGQVGELSLAGA
jgi:hypothetical protein